MSVEKNGIIKRIVFFHAQFMSTSGGEAAIKAVIYFN